MNNRVKDDFPLSPAVTRGHCTSRKFRKKNSPEEALHFGAFSHVGRKWCCRACGRKATPERTDDALVRSTPSFWFLPLPPFAKTAHLSHLRGGRRRNPISCSRSRSLRRVRLALRSRLQCCVQDALFHTHAHAHDFSSKRPHEF